MKNQKNIHSKILIGNVLEKHHFHEILKSVLKKIKVKSQGVSLPPMSEHKPNCDPNQVPLGVKLNDIELANSLKKKMSMLLTDCANTAAQSLRDDISLLWVEFIQEYGLNFYKNI